jgi:diaminopimelate decarboxylase
LADGHPVKYLDVGGGLGIDYYHGTEAKNIPLSSKADLIRSIASMIPPDVDLIIEPGRSLVATAGIFFYQ